MHRISEYGNSLGLIVWTEDRPAAYIGRCGPVRICRLKPGLPDDDPARLMHDLVPVSRTEPPRLVVSVGEATLRSDYLGVLAAVHEQHHAAGGEMVLARLNDRARKVIEICSLDRLIRIFDDDFEAVEYLTRQKTRETGGRRRGANHE